jgi:hypothetical protein
MRHWWGGTCNGRLWGAWVQASCHHLSEKKKCVCVYIYVCVCVLTFLIFHSITLYTRTHIHRHTHTFTCRHKVGAPLHHRRRFQEHPALSLSGSLCKSERINRRRMGLFWCCCCCVCVCVCVCVCANVCTYLWMLGNRHRKQKEEWRRRVRWSNDPPHTHAHAQ